MFRLLLNYARRFLAYRQLNRQRKTLDDAVRSFIEAGDGRIEELCEALLISPIDLYESVSEDEKTNVRTRMSAENQRLLYEHIQRKLFGDYDELSR